MPNYYHTSTGEKVSQATIDSRRSKAYRKIYEDDQNPSCAGCGQRSQGSAHLIPQKVCKDNGMAELCWSAENIVPSCYSCNGILEAIKSEEIKTMNCYDQLLAVTKKYLPSRYIKLTHDNLSI